MTGLPKALVMLGTWAVFAVAWWFLALQECCPVDTGGAAVSEASETPTEEPAVPVLNMPLGFLWDSEVAHTSDQFETFKASVLENMTEDNILEIRGLYYEAEKQPDSATAEGEDAEVASLGLARAAAIRALFPEIPAERMLEGARTITTNPGRDTFNYFKAYELNWVEAEKTVAETVEELDDRIIIRFPFGSTEKEYNEEVDAYLSKLAERVASTGENIVLTGHTDNVGSNEKNMELGQNRADAIKSILVNAGVSADLVSTSSRGESQPARSNSTEEGRYENRRVEVQLIKNESTETEE